MHTSGPNLSTGFYASAVNIGRLQAALEHGLARFDETQLETRWDEIFDWILRVARTWVQRCKGMRIERRQMGIRSELETQDDLGTPPKPTLFKSDSRLELQTVKAAWHYLAALSQLCKWRGSQAASPFISAAGYCFTKRRLSKATGAVPAGTLREIEKRKSVRLVWIALSTLAGSGMVSVFQAFSVRPVSST